MWQCKFCDSWNADEEANCPICDKSRQFNRTQTLTKIKADKLGLTGKIVIPENFNVIGEGAFKSRTDITSVVLHSSVKKVSQEAFCGCINLKEVKCEGKLSSIGSRAFGNCVALRADKRPIANRYTAEDAFFVDSELYEIDSLIVSLKDFIKRYMKIELSQRSRGASTQKIQGAINDLTIMLSKMELYKIAVAGGDTNILQSYSYASIVSSQKKAVARCEAEEAKIVLAVRKRERRRVSSETTKKNRKRNLAIGISVVGVAAVIAAILLIVLL